MSVNIYPDPIFGPIPGGQDMCVSIHQVMAFWNLRDRLWMLNSTIGVSTVLLKYLGIGKTIHNSGETNPTEQWIKCFFLLDVLEEYGLGRDMILNDNIAMATRAGQSSAKNQRTTQYYSTTKTISIAMQRPQRLVQRPGSYHEESGS